MLKKFKREIRYWFEGLITILPYSLIGNTLRRMYWTKRLKVQSNKIAIFPGVKFFSVDSIKIGGGVNINYNVLIDASEGSIQIGNNVLIGPNCVLRAADHVFSDITQPINRQGHIGGRIIIEEDCWLSANVVVLRDVTIGKGSVIGAGAVVTKSIPPYSIAVGIPARVIGQRK